MYQNQDQFRKYSLFTMFYYGLQDPNNKWQWQETHRFDLGDYSWGGYTQTSEFANHFPNGAWQHEYEWRSWYGDYLNYCYAQSYWDEYGYYRYPSYFCNIGGIQYSGDYSPVYLPDPSFRYHSDW